MDRKAQILTALEAFVAQRPGIEPGNYSDAKSYRSESRSVTRDRHDAEKLIRFCAIYNVTEEQLREAFGTFSGRLTLTEHGDGSVSLDYCTGQYFPTEYRKAVCAVLGTALFDFVRANQSAAFAAGERTKPVDGDSIRAGVRKLIGARLQRRWVD